MPWISLVPRPLPGGLGTMGLGTRLALDMDPDTALAGLILVIQRLLAKPTPATKLTTLQDNSLSQHPHS